MQHWLGVYPQEFETPTFFLALTDRANHSPPVSARAIILSIINPLIP
jgi:hypothetical protein